MSNAGMMSGAAGRYAAALFDLANEQGALDSIAADLEVLQGMIEGSNDLQALILTPSYGRDAQGKAMAALTQSAGLSDITRNFVGLLCQNGRLNVIAEAIQAFRTLRAQARGEQEVEVISAHPLSDSQRERLAATLQNSLGNEVTINASVDESLLGGLIVRVGSRMIDASLKSKLASLQSAMIRA